MSRAKRFLYRTSEIFDYRTFVVATGFLVLLIVGAALLASLRAAHDATVSANLRGQAASRRIDLLNTQIRELQAAIAAGKDERGQLAAAVAALTSQIRQLGGQPVITVSPGATIIVRPSPSSSPSPRHTQSPTPRPSLTRSPNPHPTPSPTCTSPLGLFC